MVDKEEKRVCDLADEIEELIEDNLKKWDEVGNAGLIVKILAHTLGHVLLNAPRKELVRGGVALFVRSIELEGLEQAWDNVHNDNGVTNEDGDERGHSIH